MAVVAGYASLKIDNGAGSSLIWSATAAVSDTPAGSSVVVTITYASTGSLIAAADTLDLDIYIDNGSTLVKSFSLNPALGSQTCTFFFTADGTGPASARCGLLRMRLHAVNTTAALGANRYNVDSDLTNNTPPTGSTVTIHDQGYIRGTTTASTVLAGAGTLGYGDTLTATTTLGAAPYQSRTLNVALSPIAATASAASTTVTFTTALGTVDNRFPASSASRTTAVTFPNASLVAIPWTTATLTESTRTIDPRLSFTHHLQVNSSSFATPPSARAVTRLKHTQVGYIAARVVNANGTGVNGITWTTTVQDAAALNAALTATPTSATAGGEAGWGSTLLKWLPTPPMGAYSKTVTITAPAGAVGLGTGTTQTLQLLGRCD